MINTKARSAYPSTQDFDVNKVNNVDGLCNYENKDIRDDERSAEKDACGYLGVHKRQ